MENNSINIKNILPTEFCNRIKNMLNNPSDYESFLNSFNDEAIKSVHVNTKRFNLDSFKNIKDYSSNYIQIPYYENGFYDYSGSKIGYNPLNHAGVLYSQDPAAMMPVSLLSTIIKGNEKVLDLCSAPGGKASQVAMLLDDKDGFLVANEINPARNKILCSNIERMGYMNVLITKLDPASIADYYNSYFDIVIVDAPCSGEGMFRKYPDSINEWSPENVNLCQARQKEILTEAVKCVNPGGYLLYSTCTYSIEEDESIVSWLIDNFDLESVMPNEQVINNTRATSIEGARKFFPHIAKGEGQFLCLLHKKGESLPNMFSDLGKISPLSKQEVKTISSELDSIMMIDYNNLYKYMDKIIYISNPNVKICSKGVTSAFVTVGTFERNKFTPHHQLFHTLGDYCKNYVNYSIDAPEIIKYLHGEEIYNENVIKGYGVLKVEGVPIGGYKASGGRLKNHYPKGLRNNN